MKRRKLTEILIETVETVIVPRPKKLAGEPVTTWCGECEREVAMIAPDAAAELAGASTRDIFRLVEAGQLHFAETPQGRLFICLDSLTKQASVAEEQPQAFASSTSNPSEEREHSQ